MQCSVVTWYTDENVLQLVRTRAGNDMEVNREGGREC